jgi:hypothetical protein
MHEMADSGAAFFIIDRVRQADGPVGYVFRFYVADAQAPVENIDRSFTCVAAHALFGAFREYRPALFHIRRFSYLSPLVEEAQPLDSGRFVREVQDRFLQFFL